MSQGWIPGCLSEPRLLETSQTSSKQQDVGSQEAAEAGIYSPRGCHWAPPTHPLQPVPRQSWRPKEVTLSCSVCSTLWGAPGHRMQQVLPYNHWFVGSRQLSRVCNSQSFLLLVALFIFISYFIPLRL